MGPAAVLHLYGCALRCAPRSRAWGRSQPACRSAATCQPAHAAASRAHQGRGECFQQPQMLSCITGRPRALKKPRTTSTGWLWRAASQPWEALARRHRPQAWAPALRATRCSRRRSQARPQPSSPGGTLQDGQGVVGASHLPGGLHQGRGVPAGSAQPPALAHLALLQHQPARRAAAPAAAPHAPERGGREPQPPRHRHVRDGQQPPAAPHVGGGVRPRLCVCPAETSCWVGCMACVGLSPPNGRACRAWQRARREGRTWLVGCTPMLVADVSSWGMLLGLCQQLSACHGADGELHPYQAGAGILHGAMRAVNQALGCVWQQIAQPSMLCQSQRLPST